MGIKIKSFLDLKKNSHLLFISGAAILVGLLVGIVDMIFGIVLNTLTAFRETHFLYLIPFLFLAGLLIVFIYDHFGGKSIKGMSLVFDVADEREVTIPKRLVPLAIFSTWLTHLFGGSAGREGVAIQVGAALSHAFSPVFKFEESSRSFLIIGIAAGFAGLFQTPMAAILFVVAYNMSDVPRFIRMLILAPRPDQIILLLTFFLTIFTDLVVAVNVGVVLAVLQFMRKMVNTIDVHEASSAELSAQIRHEITIHPEIMVYTVDGPLFFGAISAFDRALNSIHKDPKYLIIRFVKVPFVDLTGLRILRGIIEELQKRGIEVLLSDVSYDIRREMYKSDFLDILGRHHMYRQFESALHKAEHDLALKEAREV